MKNYPQEYYTPYQLKLPLEISTKIDVEDPVYSFCEVIHHIDLNSYLTSKERRTGRPRYDEVTLLKIILFAFMEDGYVSVRRIEKLCKTDIRFMWLLQEHKAPSHMTIDNFMKNTLSKSIEQIFADINAYIFSQNHVDTDHCYIDGTKIQANANKYSWVWKKSCMKSIQKIFLKLPELFQQMNEIIAVYGVEFGTREEYAVEYLEEIRQHFATLCGFDPAAVVRGRGHRKTPEQRLYDQLSEYIERLKKYADHIQGNTAQSLPKEEKSGIIEIWKDK